MERNGDTLLSQNNMLKKINLLAVLFSLLFIPVVTSCGGSDPDPDDNSYYDFSILWDVVDKGDYTTAEAQIVAAQLTATSEDIFTACTEAYAVREFNNFCEELRYMFATGYMKITLKARLVRNEGNRQVATKTFYIDPKGTTIKGLPMDVQPLDATVTITD